MFLYKRQSHSYVSTLGHSVQVKKAKNKGKIEIEFYSEDDLERILEILNVKLD